MFTYATNPLLQWFSNFFILRHTKKNKKTSRHTKHKKTKLPCLKSDNLNSSDEFVSEKNEFETRFCHRQIPLVSLRISKSFSLFFCF